MGACQSKTSTDLGQLSKLKEDVRLDQERRRSSVNGGVMPLNVTTGEKVAPATPGEIQPETPATVGGLPELPDLPPEVRAFHACRTLPRVRGAFECAPPHQTHLCTRARARAPLACPAIASNAQAAPAGEMPELCVETDTAALLPGEEPNMLQKALSPLYSLVSPVAKLLSPKPPSPIKPDPAKNGLLHESGCPWCGTKVYIAERVLCLGREWHKTCLKCISCTKTLQLGQQLDHAKKPYCKTCHTKQFGPKGFGFGGAMSAERHSEVAEPAASVLSPIEATTASSDPVLEQAMVEWVAMVTGLELGGNGGATPRSALALKDGVALCELLNKIEPGSVARIPFAKPRTPFNELENLNEYLRACAALGVPDAVLFPPGALHQGANLDAVVRHLQYMFEVAGQIEGFSGKLGKWVLDKRMRMWLTDVSGVDVRVGELHPQLRDGFALCTLANAIEPGSIAKSLLQPATSKFGALETIAAFVQVRARDDAARAPSLCPRTAGRLAERAPRRAATRARCQCAGEPRAGRGRARPVRVQGAVRRHEHARGHAHHPRARARRRQAAVLPRPGARPAAAVVRGEHPRAPRVGARGQRRHARPHAAQERRAGGCGARLGEPRAARRDAVQPAEGVPERPAGAHGRDPGADELRAVRQQAAGCTRSPLAKPLARARPHRRVARLGSRHGIPDHARTHQRYARMIRETTTSPNTGHSLPICARRRRGATATGRYGCRCAAESRVAVGRAVAVAVALTASARLSASAS